MYQSAPKVLSVRSIWVKNNCSWYYVVDISSQNRVVTLPNRVRVQTLTQVKVDFFDAYLCSSCLNLCSTTGTLKRKALSQCFRFNILRLQINARDFTSILYCRNAVLTYMLQPPEVLQKMLLWHLPAAAIQSRVKSTNNNPFLHETKRVLSHGESGRHTHTHTEMNKPLLLRSHCYSCTCNMSFCLHPASCIRSIAPRNSTILIVQGLLYFGQRTLYMQ